MRLDKALFCIQLGCAQGPLGLQNRRLQRSGIIASFYIVGSEMLHYTSKGVVLLLLKTKIGYLKGWSKFGPQIVKPFRLGYVSFNRRTEELAFKNRESFRLIHMEFVKHCPAFSLLVSCDEIRF